MTGKRLNRHASNWRDAVPSGSVMRFALGPLGLPHVAIPASFRVPRVPAALCFALPIVDRS